MFDYTIYAQEKVNVCRRTNVTFHINEILKPPGSSYMGWTLYIGISLYLFCSSHGQSDGAKRWGERRDPVSMYVMNILCRKYK